VAWWLALEKNSLNNNVSLTCPYNMARSVCELGAPQQIFVTAATSLIAHRRPTKLYTLFGCLLGCYAIYTISRALARQNFARCNIHFTLSLAFFYIGSVTARHSSSGREPNFAAWYKEWNYRTFAEGATYIRQGGHHVWHGPTF